MRLGGTIGKLLILASLLQGCLPLLILVDELKRTEIEKEIRARPVGDPGPIATVAMFSLGGSPAEPVEPNQGDSVRCEIDARMSTTSARLATERYVECMAKSGYRCADRSEHQACVVAWTHPTATREQWLQDGRECMRVVREERPLAFAYTVRPHWRKCMRSNDYRADVGEVEESRP